MSRQDLVQNAVVFLSDPKSQASPLAQRIQFLEAKGLTPTEIDEAVKQAARNQPVPSQQANYQSAYGPSPFSFGPQQHQPWDWRDYFITAVVSGTAAYGAVSMFKKYLLPHLQPPSTTVYEDDRDALTAQFDAAEARLKEIQAETAAIRAAVDAQHEKIESATSQVQSVVQDMKTGEQRTRDELREIREEVDNVREMLPKMIDKNKDNQNQSLAELQQELKSLKALLLSRGPSIPGVPSVSSPPPILSSTPGRPAIPSWQLAPPTVNGVDSGKGKEVEGASNVSGSSSATPSS